MEQPGERMSMNGTVMGSDNGGPWILGSYPSSSSASERLYSWGPIPTSSEGDQQQPV